MSKWNFKTVQFNSNGDVEYVDLSTSQQAKVNKYIEALETATSSVVANPHFSNYFVKEGVGLVDGAMLSAGNIEYGICQALHGEESAVASFRANYGRGVVDDDIILGIIAGNPNNIAAPCGNCRDIMLDDFGTNFEIVSGAAEGGTAIVASMGCYLFSEFSELGTDNVDFLLRHQIGYAIEEGDRLLNDAYSPKDVCGERKYHALIITASQSFVGARDIMCDYHPIYALRDAIRQVRRASDPFVQSVIIVCEDFDGGPPHVMYKDRQHLLELNLQAELLVGQESDPDVFLANYDENKELTGLWQTSVKEWLPFAFNPRNFGPEFIEYLTKYFQGLK